MATTWGAFSGHMRVGIDYTHAAITSSTTSVTVTAHFYIQIDSTWNFADNQALEVSGSGAAHYDYYNGLGANAVLEVGQFNFNSGALSSSGGPTFTFRGTVSGHYQGAAPTHIRSYTMPAKPSTTPGAPSVGISNVGINSAKITVGAPSSNGGAAILEYSTQVDNSSGFGSPEATFAGTGTASGLSASTTYYVRARARNTNGWGPYSATKSFTTGATVPGVPTSFSVGSVGESTATPSWGAPTSNGGSAIDDYTLQTATNSGFTANVLSYTVDGLNKPLTGLTPGTQYWTRVRANNGVGPGAYTAAQTFTTLSGTPSVVLPTAGSVQTNGVFDVTVQAGGFTGNRTITAQVSKDNTFATGVKTVVLPAPINVSANNQYRLRDTSQYLGSGTWYVRAKVTNLSTGYNTPWSSTVSFSQSHIPSAAVVSPTAGELSQYSAIRQFVFRFTDAADPNDWMTAYQIQIQNNATSAVVYDSAKTALTSTPQDNTIERNIAIDSAQKGVGLRWRAKVWDRNDDASAYTGWALFTLVDPPVIDVTAPSDLLPVDNGAPTIAWMASFPSGGSQVSALVSVYEADTNTLVWERQVIGNATSVTPEVVILRNAHSYYADVTVTDSAGLSAGATQSFTTEYDSPDAFFYYTDAQFADDLGYILVDWSDANPDEMFAAWKIYRRELEGEWELLDTITNQNVRQYYDYMLQAGKIYLYSVTQTATRSGALLESPVGYYMVDDQEVAEGRSYSPELSHYWLLNPADPTQNILLPGVTEDPTTLEFEDATYNIIGRGRHKDYGDEIGLTGTLTCQVRTPENPSSFKLRMVELRRSKETYVLRKPFGDLIQIAIGNLGWTPIGGVGLVEMGDMSIPYEEVH